MLIKELAGGSISSDIIDSYPEPIEGYPVTLTMDKLNQVTGNKLDPIRVKSILESLEITILSEEDGLFQLMVPAYRIDVRRDVDVIEDILRIYGYNKVVFDQTMHFSISPSVKPDRHRMQELIADQLTASGVYELMNNSLTSSAYYEGLTSLPENRCVKLLNPLSSDLNVMRQTLLFGGLESIAYNRNRKHPDLACYEFGKCYWYREEKKSASDGLAPYAEEDRLALWMTVIGKPNLGTNHKKK